MREFKPKQHHLLFFLAILFLLCLVSLSSAARVGIFVHGCNTYADSWESIVWGDEEKDETGRITQALAIVRVLEQLQSNSVKCVMWGSGVPSLENGLKESEYTIKTMRAKLADAVAASARGKQNVPGLINTEDALVDVAALMSKITHIPQRTSTNTITELHECFDFFSKEKIEVVVLVSSSCHAPRCLRDASIALAEWNKKEGGGKNAFKPLLLCSPSETTYAKSKAEDVVIFEPPHIPPTPASPPLSPSFGSSNSTRTASGDVLIMSRQLDHHALIFQRNSLARRILKSRKLSADPLLLQNFNNELDALLRKYE